MLSSLRLFLPLVAMLGLALPSMAQIRDEAAYFVPGRAFAPLTADPRWPSFNIGYSRVLDGDGIVFDPNEYADLWVVSVGDTIAFYRSRQWEFGAQAAFFSTFDLEAPSQPLINTDFQGGVYAAVRRGDWSGLTRLYHQSSHLGDELLLFGPSVTRTNASHDAVELLISRVVNDGDLRLYGGGGVIVNQTGRDDFGDFVLQYGLELTPSRLRMQVGKLTVTPTVALDLQHLDGRDFGLDLSVVAGLRLSNRASFGLTYYNGRNVNGQFFTSDLETLGINLRVSL